MSEIKLTKDSIQNAILTDSKLVGGYVNGDGYISAIGNGAVAMGYANGGNIEVSGNGAHAEGYNTRALADGAHAEGMYTLATGTASHASGIGTIANQEAMTAIGKYNYAFHTGYPGCIAGDCLFEVGNGTGWDPSRGNAFAVTTEGITASLLNLSGGSYQGESGGKISWSQGSCWIQEIEESKLTIHSDGDLYLQGDSGIYANASVYISNNGLDASRLNVSSAIITKINNVSVGNDPKFTDTIYRHPGVTVSKSTSSVSPSHNGTFSVIDDISIDSSGHVTKINTKTVKLPTGGSIDTDTKQSITPSTKNDKVYLTGVSATTTTSEGYADASVYMQNGGLNASSLRVTTATITKINNVSVGNDPKFTDTVYKHPTITATTNTSTATLGYSGTFTVVNSVSTNTNGHVTKIDTKTFTLPAIYTHPGVSLSTSSSTATLGYSGTFTVVNSVSTNTNGHVTKIDTKTFTLPANPNTDEKVKVSTSTSNNDKFPLMAVATSSPNNTNAYQAICDSSSITINPSKHSVAEGNGTKANGNYSHAEGYQTFTLGEHSHAEGQGGVGTLQISKINSNKLQLYSISTTISGSECKLQVGDIVCKAESYYAKVTAIDGTTITVDDNIRPRKDEYISWIKGMSYKSNAHSEGYLTVASGNASHAEGEKTIASGDYSHTEGYSAIASGRASHAGGYAYGIIDASGTGSFAHGYAGSTNGAISATGDGAVAMGYVTVGTISAAGPGAVAMGYAIYNGTISATGDGAVAMGYAYNGAISATGKGAHAEGYNTAASATASHAGGYYTIANVQQVTAIGRFNQECLDGDLFVVGNGKNINTRKTVFKVSDSSGSITGGNNAIVTVTGQVNATGGFYDESDIRKKEVLSNISLEKSYELLDKCQEIIYVLKDDPNKKEQVGMIAQEVEEFFPEIVSTDNDGFKSLDYARLSVICLRLIKDIVEQIKEIKNKIKNING